MNTTDSANWGECDLSELIAVIESGQRPYGGATEESGEIPSLGGENIRQGGGLELSALKKVPTDFYRAMTKGVLQTQDVLINKDGANTGKAAIYDGQLPVATINEHLFLLRGKCERLTQRFLYRVLISESGQRTVRARISGSAQPGLKLDFIRNFSVRFPKSTAEQSLIAAVLDTVDEAIAKTEAVIAKLKQVRAGLLHDLLTRGLDEHGQLRDPIAHPEQFQDSPLGRIPGEWRCSKFDDVLDGIDAGKSPDYPDYPAPPGEWGVLKVSAVWPDKFRPHENKWVTKAIHQNSAYVVRDGDLLISRSNTYELVGLVSLVRDAPSRLMLCDKTLRLRLKADRGVNPFFALLLQTRTARRQIEVNATGTSGSMKNISQDVIRELVMAYPGVKEQQRILVALSPADQELEALRYELAKLFSLKSGLMTDLLTGRVRVSEGIRVG